MIILLAVVGALSAGPPGFPVAQDSARPVSGHWQYNPRDSDEPRRHARGTTDSTMGMPPDGMSGGREGGGTMGPPPGGMGGGMGGMGGMGGGGMRPRGGAMPSREDMERRVTLMSLAFEAPQLLDLSESDTAFSVIELLRLGPDTLMLPTNWHKVQRRLNDDVRLEMRAKRQDGRLMIERKVNGAGKVTETYYLSPDRSQLFVLVRLEAEQGAGMHGGGGGYEGREGREGGEGGEARQGGEGGERGPRTFRRVYDRVP